MLPCCLIIVGSTAFLFFPGLAPIWLVLVIAAAFLFGNVLMTRQQVGPPRLVERGLIDLLLVLGPLGALVLTRTPAALAVPIWIVSSFLFVWAGRARKAGAEWLAPVVAIVWFAFVSVVILRVTGVPHIDVYQYLNDGVRAQLHGENPFAITMTNVYSAAENAENYGPGFLVDGRVPFGFPYPPVLLILAVPGYLLGDARYTSVLLASLTALAVLGRGRDPRRRLESVMLLAAPGTWWVISQAWTEVGVVALFGAAAFAVARGKLVLAAALVGALLVSKQYFIVALPALWTLRPYATRARVVVMTATATILTVPWFLASPQAFIHSVVEFQTSTPMRFDSLGLLVEVVKSVGGADSGAFRALPIVVGLGVATAAAVRAPQRAGGFAAATCLSVLVAMLMAKQVFFNYYYFIACGLLITAAVWDRPPGAAEIGTNENGHSAPATTKVSPSLLP